MAVEVTVGPPVITINHGHTFLVTEFDGSITNASDQGLYCRGHTLCQPLPALYRRATLDTVEFSETAYWGSRAYLVNPEVATDQGMMASGIVGLMVTRAVSDALHEDLGYSQL